MNKCFKPYPFPSSKLKAFLINKKGTITKFYEVSNAPKLFSQYKFNYIPPVGHRSHANLDKNSADSVHIYVFKFLYVLINGFDFKFHVLF